jgi:hypothetical protein
VVSLAFFTSGPFGGAMLKFKNLNNDFSVCIELKSKTEESPFRSEVLVPLDKGLYKISFISGNQEEVEKYIYYEINNKPLIYDEKNPGYKLLFSHQPGNVFNDQYLYISDKLTAT